MFIPTTKQELNQLGWERCDIILVTGDTYVDHPMFGVAVIGKLLLNSGYRVGIIAQPSVHSEKDIGRLGEPELFWGVTGGCLDSMVANYTPTKKRRKSDDMTPGGINNRRPDRAVIVYTNLIKKIYKNTKPIVLGGIEASLRRIAHYDYWSDSIRRSILFDAKADLLLYGMAEKSVLTLADRFKKNQDYRDMRGLCWISKTKIPGYLELPSYQKVKTSKSTFIEMFHHFYKNSDFLTAKGLIQKQDTRYLVQNPPTMVLSQKEMDSVYEADFEREQHPYYDQIGSVKALETIRFSMTSHQGCYGECNFCSIGFHQGRLVTWRSKASLVREAKKITNHKAFKGIIHDVGGPTANMYGFECEKKLKSGSCINQRCLFPEICQSMKVDHSHQLHLLKSLRKLPKIKKVFIASGIRYDLILLDQRFRHQYITELIKHHISGQLKVAPEHSEPKILNLMGKPGIEKLIQFKKTFDHCVKTVGKPQFLTYYLIAAHPGCRNEDMKKLKSIMSRKLKIHPEQVQIFTPLPSTYSSLMYYTEIDPFTGENLFVEKNQIEKERQKDILISRRRK